MLHTIFEPLRALFIHIPKCGGGTILRTLESHLDAPNSYRSKTKKEYRKTLVGKLESSVGEERAKRFARGHEPYAIKKLVLDAEILDDYFKFAFVRNPYDRLYSAFNGYARKHTSFLTRRKKPELADINAFLKLKLQPEMFPNGTFEEACLDEETLFIHFLPQHQFLCDEGQMKADFIGRMERFDDDSAVLYERLGLTEVSPVTRHIEFRGDLTAPSRYLEQFDRESIDLVNRLYGKDFELLGYDRA